MSITIPTSELIGGLSDVLPQITDPKGDHAGVQIAWTGETLTFTAYDVYSAAEVYWLSGEGDENDADEDTADDIDWGGHDAPWRTWVSALQAKEIVKVFKLPAKLWRFPVEIGCANDSRTLTIHREDGPRTGRELIIPADPGECHQIPDVRAIAYAEDRDADPAVVPTFAPYRMAAFGSARSHGVMQLFLGDVNQPVGIRIGQRFAGFLYQSGAKAVHRYNALRDGAGVMTS